MLLLDPEVVAGQVELQVGRVPDRRHVARSVPGGADAEELAQRGQLPGHAQPADVRNVDADEIDQPIADERDVFGLIHEQLAHRDRNRRLLTQDAKVLDVFWRKRVFEKKELVGLEVAREPDRLDGWHPLVDVVEQLDLVAEVGAHALEQPGNDAAVRPGLPGRLIRPEMRGLLGIASSVSGGSVSGVAGHVHLAPHVAVALVHEPPSRVLDLFEIAARSVRIQRRSLAALTTEQLIDGHARPLALDIPQRLVHAGERVVEHRPTAPVGADVGRLINVFDVVRIAPDQERLEILLDRRDHDQRALSEGRAAKAIQAGLARLDFHDDESDAIRRCADGFHARNAEC